MSTVLIPEGPKAMVPSRIGCRIFQPWNIFFPTQAVFSVTVKNQGWKHYFFLLRRFQWWLLPILASIFTVCNFNVFLKLENCLIGFLVIFMGYKFFHHCQVCQKPTKKCVKSARHQWSLLKIFCQLVTDGDENIMVWGKASFWKIAMLAYIRKSLQGFIFCPFFL